MERRKGYYALIQYSPFPERHEFVNVGVLLYVPEEQFLQVKFTDDQRRIERLFGKQDKNFILIQQKALESRLKIEKTKYLNVELLENFARLRANALRITPLWPAAVGEPCAYLQALFDELVSEAPVKKRLPPVQSKLKIAFKEAGVLQYLTKPAPVALSDYGITVSALFAYQNGHFNLIEPMRLDENPDEALKEAGKRAFEGGWLAKAEPDKRLVVVGDFSHHPEKFYGAVNEVMRDHQVHLYRLDALQPLIQEIEQAAQDHGRVGSVLAPSLHGKSA